MDILVPESLQKARGLVSDLDDFTFATLPAFLDVIVRENEIPPRYPLHEILAHKHGVHIEKLEGMPAGVAKTAKRIHLCPTFNFRIPPFPGARKMLWWLKRNVGLAYYLSARPNHLQQATESSIAVNGFPVEPVLLRPPEVDLHVNGSALSTPTWKAGILERCTHVHGIADDDPRLIGKLQNKWLFLYGPQRDADIELARRTPRVVHCPNYRTLIEAVRKNILEK